MSESAKIGRGKRSPARQKYKNALVRDRNKRLRKEWRAKHPQTKHPLKGLARARRRMAMGISKEPARVLKKETHNGN